MWSIEPAHHDNMVFRSPTDTNRAPGSTGNFYAGTYQQVGGTGSAEVAAMGTAGAAYNAATLAMAAYNAGTIATYAGSMWMPYASLIQEGARLSLPAGVGMASTVGSLVAQYMQNFTGDTVMLQVGSSTTNAETDTEAPTYLDWAVKRVTDISATSDRLSGAASEALRFLAKLSADSPRPSIWTDSETEIVFEWIDGPRHAVVSFEGDGEFGYAIKADGLFVPGAFRGDPKGSLPADLSEYINAK
jgi:hypothetical protein